MPLSVWIQIFSQNTPQDEDHSEDHTREMGRCDHFQHEGNPEQSLQNFPSFELKHNNLLQISRKILSQNITVSLKSKHRLVICKTCNGTESI